MTNPTGLRGVLVACTLFILSSCTSNEDRISKQPVVSVNARSLDVKEFARRLATEMKAFDALYAKHPQNVARVKEDVVQKFINEALIEEWAAQNGINITDTDLEAEVRKIRGQYPDDISFRGAFAKEGLSLDTWKERLRKSLLAQAVYAKVTNDVKAPADGELQDYYKVNRAKFQKEPRIRLRQIVVEKEDDSKRILEELKKGQSFERLAREFSIGPEAKAGGDAGWIEKGTLEAFDSAFSLGVGKRSEIVKSPYGFHIFEVIDKRPASQLNFDQARATILQTLRAEREREQYLSWLKQQLQKARVLRNDALISDVKVYTEIE